MTTSRMRRALGALVLTIALGAPGMVGASSQSLTDPRSGLVSGRTLPILLRSAHLTPEQRTQVQAILAARRPGIRALIRDVQQAQDELADRLLGPGPLQMNDVQPQLAKIGKIRDRLMQESAQITIEIRGVLTPEQIARAGLAKDKLRQLRSEVQQLLQTEP